MKLTSPIDVTVLTWLKPELDSTLHQARNSLEQYVEEGRGVTSLRECIVHLHQVAGILNIVELAGASKLAEEMEQLAYGLAEGEVQASDNAFSFLMQCIVQLPDYLERLQNGHKDVPIILLPLINELRSLRNESELGAESVYGAATLLPIPEQAFNLSSSANSNLEFSELALQFQACLLAWFNNQEDLQAAKNLAVSCSQIGSKNQDDSSRKVFWVASVLLQAVANGQLKLTNALRNSIAKIDKEVDYINNRIVGEVRKSSPARLTQELLYFVSQNYKCSDDLRQVYEVFELEHNIPNASEIEHARSSLLGRNNALLQSVSAVIKEDILRVKDALDMSIRNADAAPKDFVELVNLLNRIENTLGLIDANEAKDLINNNKEIIKNSLDNATILTESELMAIAKSLLSVEFLLDHHGANTSGNNADKLKSDFLTSSQSNQLLDVLIRESIVNFTEVQAAFVAFVENHWDHSQLAAVPALFKQVSGALDILEFSQVSNFINALSSFTRYEFIENQKIPTSENMERLAEALASLEYYLESVRDRRPNRARILDITQKNLEALNYWPVPDYATNSPVFGGTSVASTPAPPQAIVNDEFAVIAPAQEAIATDHKTVSADETAVDNDNAVNQGQIIIGFDLNAEGIDDEIREIFLEEFAEESENLNGFFDDWKSDFENIELLRPIRRVFHTFKGSGKLVGAKDLSDYSWKVESLLNRVLDGSRPPSAEVVSIIGKTVEILPSFNEALLGGTVFLDIAGLSNVVDRLAAGEELTYQEPKSVSSTPITEAKVLREPIIDPVLFEILKPEVSGHLETVKAWLERAQSSQSPIFEDSVFRAVHTMNGAFAMSEVPSMTELLAPTEALLRRSIAHKNPAKSDTLLFIGQVVNAVQQTLDALTENSAPIQYQDLTKRAFELRDELPERLEVDRLEAERLAAEQLEVARLEAERVEAERVAAERVAAERVEAERVEAERVAAERVEAERIAADRVAAEQLEAERVAAERVEAEQLEVARLEAERVEAERVEAERVEAERIAADRVAAEQLEAERVEAEQLEVARVEAERVAAERVETERVAAEQLEVARVEAERVAAERVAAERVEAERVEAEQLEVARVEAERVATERVEAEQLEAARVAAERVAAERVVAEQFEVDHVEAERVETESVETDNFATEQLEVAPIESKRGSKGKQFESARAAAKRLKSERAELAQLEAERAESARLEAAPFEAARLEAERIEAELVEAARLEAAPFEAARLEAERVEAERVEAERVEAERVEAERVAAEQLEVASLEAERIAEEPVVAEPEASEVVRGKGKRVESARAEAKRLKAELIEAERIEAERIEAERVGAERVEAESVDVATFEFEASKGKPVETKRAEAKRIKAERLEAERLEAERVAAEQLEVAHLEAERVADTLAEISAAAHREDQNKFAETNNDAEQEGLMERLDMHELDEELLDIFTEEAKDLLDQSDNILVALKSTPENFEHLYGLQRHLHTIKGGARMAGLFSIGELSHSLETLLQHNTEQQIVPNAKQISIIERSLDALHKMAHSVEERKAPELPNDIMKLLDASMLTEESSKIPEQEESDAAKTDVLLFKPLSGPIAVPEMEIDEGLRTPQEVVRIRADLLEQLVNFSGEVAIYRARLEQQLGLFKINLVELDQTTTRLREQLRRLDIETEAQITARNIREGDQKRQDFDPLELDRFTTQQQLSRSLAETSNDLANLQATMDDLTRHHETLLLQQSRVSTELQEGLMRTRMLPFDTLLPRLRRVLRQASQDAGKDVQLRVEGAQGEMDRTVLDRMIAPLEHLLRNAVAHGIEEPIERKKAGKADSGLVVISIAHEGTEVVLTVRDDGRGLNSKQIHKKGIERGLISADAEMSEQQILSLITQTGFSTADTVTRLSGRGVGMDVVNSEIKSLNGSLSIQSAINKGTEFIVRLPLNLAVTKAVFVKIGDSKYAIPIASVDGVGRIGREELEEKSKLDSPEFSYAGNTHKIYDLGQLLDMPKSQAVGSMQMPMLLSKSGQDKIAVCVDQVLGSQEIVVKPVGPQVTSIPGVYGASILPDGGVIVILDLAPLVRHNANRSDQVVEKVAEAAVRSKQVVMVVDDSITMRKVTSRILERNNFEVILARDGLEAIEKMAEQVPDLVLLDIEMPRMDGYEVAQNMKSDERLMNVPIMMITSRTGDKHRQRALDLGVERYLGKPYQELELMRQVNEVFNNK